MVSQYIIYVVLTSLECVTAYITFESILSSLANIPQDGRLPFSELANKYGYKCDTYHVITNDGYNLTLFNIPGDRSKPVLLQHGFVDSSDTWLVRTTTSLAAYLANNSYDVWFGNMRGNKYSRSHVTLNPDRDLKFWDFSFHEIATRDLPTIIDFVLEKTGQERLQAIAHSEGTTLFYVMGSMLPKYNDKIKIVISLAPIAYLHHAQQPVFPLLSVAGGPVFSGAVGFLGYGEFLRNSTVLVALLQVVCTQGLVSYVACSVAAASVLFGPDPEQFEPEFAPIALGHYPSGTSMKNGAHLLQIAATKRFAHYDYGLLNVKAYNSVQPPLYNLSQCSMKHAFVVGRTDRLSDMRDVELLKEQLPNVVDYHILKPTKWNHIDFVMGRYMYKYMFGYVLDILKKYY